MSGALIGRPNVSRYSAAEGQHLAKSADDEDDEETSSWAVAPGEFNFVAGAEAAFRINQQLGYLGISTCQLAEVPQ